MIELGKLKSRILKLLREDKEFRYAIAGLIGLEEVFKRFDKHDEMFMEVFRRLEEHDKKFNEVLARLEEHDKKFNEVLMRLDRHEEILARHSEEIKRLREDMVESFNLLRRHIDALGARWGLMAEEAFRDGLRGLLKEEFGFKVEKWVVYDEAGRVFGYPSNVDVDVTVKDGRVILVEVSSHIRLSDILQFKRKAELYEEKTGRKPDRLLIVTPYIDEEALKASRRLGVEVYTKV